MAKQEEVRPRRARPCTSRNGPGRRHLALVVSRETRLLLQGRNRAGLSSEPAGDPAGRVRGARTPEPPQNFSFHVKHGQAARGGLSSHRARDPVPGCGRALSRSRNANPALVSRETCAGRGHRVAASSHPAGDPARRVRRTNPWRNQLKPRFHVNQAQAERTGQDPFTPSRKSAGRVRRKRLPEPHL